MILNGFWEIGGLKGGYPFEGLGYGGGDRTTIQAKAHRTAKEVLYQRHERRHAATDRLSCAELF